MRDRFASAKKCTVLMSRMYVLEKPPFVWLMLMFVLNGTDLKAAVPYLKKNVLNNLNTVVHGKVNARVKR